MRHRLLFLVPVLCVAATQSTVFVTAGVGATTSSPVASAPGNSPTSPGTPPSGGGGVSTSSGTCGLGYTYCGYILRDHQGYHENDIIKAYCAGAKDNCASDKTKSDPFQSLYVCLPNGTTSSAPQHEVKNRLARILGRGKAASSPGGPAPSAGAPGGCSTATAGNKLQLLCSCNRSCLDPEGDHIGRCSEPCS